MTTNQSRPLPDYEGIRAYHKARSTGTHVGVYDGWAAGLDSDAGRWSTICEEHSQCIAHETIHLAMAHAPHPEDWCEVCMGNEAAVDEHGVVYVERGQAPIDFADPVTCGTCGRTWDDAVVTSVTPAPAARCPFEHRH